MLVSHMRFVVVSQYLQMKWPLLDVPGTAALKDSRSPTPGHLVSISQAHTLATISMRTLYMSWHRMEKI